MSNFEYTCQFIEIIDIVIGIACINVSPNDEKLNVQHKILLAKFLRSSLQIISCLYNLSGNSNTDDKARVKCS